ncbi:acyltransferase family protein [Nocardiopsis salina]|uniref:acyltransferase family protein n=1 Tax=Nocardiopsis salina TaxID=245836 RepID=UPI00037659D3|nr:acyltransferase family protein [Nocardiopsis salina]
MPVPVPGLRSIALPGAPAGGRSGRGSGDGYRPEIEGLRAVAVALVVVYHVWFGRVSGGVDVFLLLTGFLITGSLLRMLERDGRIALTAFFSRLARRLLPPVAVVLAAVLAATYVFLPSTRWEQTLAEVRAAALYHENWALARGAVDYLAREEAASPVQHFWSLSIQGQFYLLWPLLLTLAVVVAARSRLTLRGAVFASAGAVFVLSLAYSVWITAVDQPWAYFDTGARLWELALGAMLAMVVGHLHLPAAVRAVLGWVGLVALVLCGALVPVSTMFPGWIALWPTGAAVLVIIAGTTGSRFGADRLLTRRPLMWLGGLSYGLYLWHWPVLVVYLHLTDRTTATLVGGLLVVALSVLLAYATQRWIDGGFDHLTRPAARNTHAWPAGLAAALLLPVVLSTSLWSGHLEEERRARAVLAEGDARYPGASAADPEVAEALDPAPVLPAPADARDDRPATHARGCLANGSEPFGICDEGPKEAEHTLALVGASRADHWYPALSAVAEERGWRLITFTRSGCLFDGGADTDDPVCRDWNQQAMDELERLRPDAVFTTSTFNSAEGYEHLPSAYVDTWRRLDELGIDVLGVRDLPRREFQGAECVDSRPVEECTEPASRTQDDTDPARAADLPDNVSLIDLTAHVCPGGECEAVVGNVLVFWDHSHMTATFAASLSPVVGPAVEEALGW